MTLFQEIILYITNNPWEIFAALCGIISVYLNIKENSWGWVVGIFSIIPYIWIYFKTGLLGNSFLQVFFLITNIHGWYQWKYGRTKHSDTLDISHLSLFMGLIWFCVGLLGTFILGEVIIGIAGYGKSIIEMSDLPYWDAAITVFSIIGQFLLAHKYIENWLVWILVNMIAVFLYFHMELVVTSFLYAIFLVMSFLGYAQWQRSMHSKSI